MNASSDDTRTGELTRITFADLQQAIRRAQRAQDARRRRDPAGYARDVARAEQRAADAERRRLVDQGWPRRIVTQVLAGLDESGNELVEQEHEIWLRDGLGRGVGLLVLCGWYGTGKTIGACRVCAEYAKRRPVRYMSAHRVRALSRSERDQAELDRWEEYPGILVVDEIADDEETPEQSKRISGWLQRRWEGREQTIAITNRKWKRLKEVWPESLQSRVYESGDVHRCRKVLRPGELRRQQASKEDRRDGET
jgi:hypothetical protein